MNTEAAVDSEAPALAERALPGQHDAVLALIGEQVRCRGAVLELGAGSGALAARLAAAGFSVEAADISEADFGACCPFRVTDLDQVDWPAAFADRHWDAVVAVEVIEHLRSPMTFLEQVAKLVEPDGRIILTTPNVDSLAVRVKFLLRGRLRMFEESSVGHISPIFWDLLTRVYLPSAGLRVISATTFPPGEFVQCRTVYRRMWRTLRPLLQSRPRWAGEAHILVLAPALKA